MTLFYLDLTLENYNFLEKRLQRYYPFGFPEFSLIIFISLAYQCFQAYRQLVMKDRYLAYMHLAIAVLFFLYFYPVWTGLPISDLAYLNEPGGLWAGKMWFPSWI